MKKNILSITHTSWNLAPLFTSDDESAIKKQRVIVTKANTVFVTKWQKRQDYLTDAKVLRTALDEYEQLLRNYGIDGKEGYYFWLRSMQDQTDQKIKAKVAKITDFSNRLRNELQFFELRLAKIEKKKQEAFLKDPELSQYKHFLEKIFRQAEYNLSESEEKILTLKDDPAYGKWVQMVSTFISKEEYETVTEEGKKEKKTFESLISLLSNKKKTVRDAAAKGVNAILEKYVAVAEAEINAILTNKKIDDELRKMSRPDLSRHLSDDIETEVVDTLIQTVAKRYDISQRFYRLKAQLLGVKKLAYHERNIDYVSVGKAYSLQQSVALVYKVFNDIDEEFAAIFKRFLDNGQIDVYPKKGKRGGAFCVYWLLTQPTYILLNHTDNLRDAQTLAHEMGHGINNELMRVKQNALNFGTPMATAEVASTFTEDFVLQEIVKTADEEMRFSLLLAKLDADISTIFRQAACYQFEQELHKAFREKGYLSHQEIGQLFQKNMSAYMGPTVAQSPGSENWWIYWSHIRTFFYVYSYVSGLLISKSLQKSVKENPQFIVQVKEFLSAGVSQSPKTIFGNLGIDITDFTFWNKGLDEVEATLEETEKLAIKLKKIR
ncbi:MAG TPA: M3 family oligoendopeptidase [Candidatus Sulfotelmatobacter sp.]|jgi:oligoendopeptidase F|nr:M3 family oligoendopeptidase [Candidatus Sulfotelmatobacter sp.]